MASDSIVKNVVEYIVSQIVEDTKSVKVDVADSDDENVTIEVRTAPEDMGRVLVTHDLKFAEKCDRVIKIEDGQIGS